MNLIMAATKQHADLVAESLGFGRNEWRYVTDWSSMLGITNALIFVYDTLEWRRDFPALADQLERYDALYSNQVRIITEAML